MRRLNILLIGTVLGFTLNQCNVNASLNHPFDGARGLLSNSFFTQLASIALQATATVSGRLLDSSGNPIANATLTVASSSSVRETDSESKTVSTSTKTDTAGNWTLNLRVAVFVISVTSSSGANLGTMTITVASTTSATAVPESGASFSVTGVTTTPFSNLPKPSITVRFGGVEYKNGDTITITGTKSNTNYPAELTIINNSSANLNLTAGITKAIIGGINASDFTATNPTLATLIPGATSTFTVNFNTNTLGEKVADVTVPNDDLTNSNFKLNLKGVFEPKETFVVLGNLIRFRFQHSATLLPNGRVLVTGGLNESSAELFDPLTGISTLTGKMVEQRYRHTATLLSNGKVLVIGGVGSLTAELYDPTTGVFSATGSMSEARESHKATLLSNGKVLVTGGSSNGFNGLSSAELYDPATGVFSVTGSLTDARSLHAAIQLLNGKVLIVGGARVAQTYIAPATAELYDPATGTFVGAGNMIQPRANHTTTLLSNGKLLTLGGTTNIFETSNGLVKGIASAELYDPATGIFSAVGNLAVSRSRHDAIVMSNGKVLVIGGVNGLYVSAIEIYDSTTGVSSIGANLLQPRSNNTTTLLSNGNVLVIGGGNSNLLTSIETYFP